MPLGADTIGLLNLNADRQEFHLSNDEIQSAITMYNTYLDQTHEDTVLAIDSIDSFVVESVEVLSGDVWDVVRNNLNSDKELLQKADDINGIISDINTKCLVYILNFLAEEPVIDNLNPDDLEVLEQRKLEIDNRIAELNNQNALLTSVPAQIIQPAPYRPAPNPYYETAQAEIANNNNEIKNILTPELEKITKTLFKINKFNTEIKPFITEQMELVEEQVRSYLSEVKSATSRMKRRARWSGVLKVGENISDFFVDGMAGIAANGLYLYDLISTGDNEYAWMDADGFREYAARVIANDDVKSWNENFYTVTDEGIRVADYSVYEWNGEEMQNLQEKWEFVTKFALETGAAMVTFGAVVPTAGTVTLATAANGIALPTELAATEAALVSGTIGGISEYGSTAEKVYASMDNQSISSANTEKMYGFIQGFSEGYAVGSAAISVPSGFGKIVEGGFSKISFPTGQQVWKNIADASLTSLRDPGNFIQVIGAESQKIHDGEFSVPVLLYDIVTEYGVNVACESSSNWGQVGNVLGIGGDIYDSLADAGLMSLDKTNG